MHEAYRLSLDVAYKTLAPDKTYLDVRNDIPDGEFCDKVFSWCDGLMHKYYEKVSTGHCSINEMIAFDVAAFENEVIADINSFKEFITKNGLQRVLTYAEMRERGYRGEWAGLNEAGEIINP